MPNAMTKPDTATEITCYHGSNAGPDRASWYTTDRDHAAYFGAVTDHKVTYDPRYDLWITADQVAHLGGGYEADEALYEIIREAGSPGVVVVEGWEGSGLCIITDEAEDA